MLPAGALALIALASPHVPLRLPLAAYLFAFACVGAEVLIAAASVPRLRPRMLAWLAATFGTLALIAWAGSSIPGLLAAVLVTIMLLASGTITGSVVGSAIDRPGHLLIVVVVSALVDVFSVLHPSGPTAQLVQIEAAVDVLVLPWPMLGTADIQPILGVGDVTFAAIYLAAARRHSLSVRRTIVALACALTVTAAVVIVSERGVPALPFLGVAMLAAHPEARRLPREDRVRALVGLVALALVFAMLFALR